MDYVSRLPTTVKRKSIDYVSNLSHFYTSLPKRVQQYIHFALIAFVFSPRLFVLGVFIALVFSAGILYRILFLDEQMTISTERLRELCFTHRDIVPTAAFSEFEAQFKSNYHMKSPLKESVEQIGDLILRDFIQSWFTPMNFSASEEFPKYVRMSVLSAFQKMSLALEAGNPTSVLVPIFQTLILHIREYRQFDRFTMPLESYLRKHPESSFSRLATLQSRYDYLKPLANILIEKSVVKSERSSTILHAFLNELLATNVLNSIVEVLSDPDFLNQQLLNYLKKIKLKKGLKSSGFLKFGDSKRRIRSTSSTTFMLKDANEQMFIKIVEAKNVPTTNGLNGLYCNIMCGNGSRKTRKVNAESNPIWLEEFTFAWDSAKKKPKLYGVVVDLYSGSLIQDKRIGSIYIHKNDLQPNKYINDWFRLETPDIPKENQIQIKLEIMYIVTEIPSSTPLADASFESASISVDSTRDVLANSELLMDFMQYMETINHSNFVQLYIMIDSFQQYAHMTDDAQSLKSDAMTIFDSFFGEAAKYSISIEEFGSEIVERVKNEIETNPGPETLKPLLDRVVEIMDSKHLKKFIESGVATSPRRGSLPRTPIVLRQSAEISQAATSEDDEPLSDAGSDDLISQTGRSQERTMVLGNALSSLREQIMIIDTQLDYGDEAKIRDLIKERRKLQAQVDHIVEMIEEPSPATQGAEKGDDQSFEGIQVKIFDVSTEPETHKKMAASGERKSISDLSVSSQNLFKPRDSWILNYAVHMDNSEKKEKGWVVTKYYEEFSQLHEILCDKFIKVKKMPFPPKPKSQYSGWSESARKVRFQLGRELENWVNVLLCDAIIRESLYLRQFLTDVEMKMPVLVNRPKNDFFGNAFGTARSVVKQVATNAGKLAMKAPIKVVEFVDEIADNIANVLDSSADDLSIGVVDDISRQGSIDPIPSSSGTSPAKKRKRRRNVDPNDENAISKVDLEIILECVFTSLEEAFNLSDPNQWVRQKGLKLVKTLLRRTFGDVIADKIQDSVHSAKSAEKLSSHIDLLRNVLWPNGTFFKNLPIYQRTEQEMLDTKLEAKKLFIYGGLLPTDSLIHILGKYNTINGLTRIFNMIQNRDLNRVLLCMILDNIVRSLFDSN